MSKEWQTRLLKAIDNAIIAKFVNQLDIKIPYKKGSSLLNELR
jgi:hypothetical protein